MPLELAKVQVFERQEGTNRMVLVKENPYVRFVSTSEDVRHVPIICQAGAFYTGDGKKMKREDVPEWTWDMARKVDKAKRDKIKLVLPEEYVEKTAKKRKEANRSNEPTPDEAA